MIKYLGRVNDDEVEAIHGRFAFDMLEILKNFWEGRND